MTITISISLLAHLFLLFVLLSSNIIYKSNADKIYFPASAIHVNIVNAAKERPVEKPAAEKNEKIVKVEEVRRVEKKQEPVKKQVAVTKEVKKVEVVKAVKNTENVKDTKVVIPAPVVKEKVAEQKTAVESQKSEVRSQKLETGDQKVDIQKTEILSPAVNNEKITAAQEAKLTSGPLVISGPVVDIPDFKYDYYLGLIRNKVDNRWSQPITYSQIKQTLVEFTIHRDGKIDNVGVAESSGDYYFDQTALRAVSLSNPFPPLPRGYKENVLKVRYRFIFGGKG